MNPGEAADASASIVSILVVDDNAAKRMALRTMLEPLGHTVVDADSGAAALRLLLEHDFAVILLDVRMPIMDGFETAALIRMRVRCELTPIIFVTAYAIEEVPGLDRHNPGAFDFFSAPLHAEQIRAKVSTLATRALRAASLPNPTAELEQAVIEV